jgi:hypothetical protein
MRKPNMASLFSEKRPSVLVDPNAPRIAEPSGRFCIGLVEITAAEISAGSSQAIFRRISKTSACSYGRWERPQRQSHQK